MEPAGDRAAGRGRLLPALPAHRQPVSAQTHPVRRRSIVRPEVIHRAPVGGPTGRRRGHVEVRAPAARGAAAPCRRVRTARHPWLRVRPGAVARPVLPLLSLALVGPLAVTLTTEASAARATACRGLDPC